MAQRGVPRYRYTSSMDEEHGKAVFCVAFNQVDPNHKDLFATVGADRASVYRCLPDGSFQVLQVYVDEDRDEEFFCCKWGVNPKTGAALLFLGGRNGVVRVVDCSAQKLVQSFAGHGNSINDICVHPTKMGLFLTASKDESIRLWNCDTHVCVLIAAGEGGHKNEVLSLDFHPWNAERFVSGGMDGVVKIWSLSEHTDYVDQSMTWPESSPTSFPTKFLQYPIFSSEQLHTGFIDCVRWLGDLCLSKSVDQTILLWRAEETHDTLASTSTRFTVLQEFPLPDTFIWFLRFSLDYASTLLACGNRSGKVFVWDPHQSPPHCAKLTAPQCKSVVRQAALSWDGSIVLAGCEDGTVWRWDRIVGDAATDGATATATTEGNGGGGSSSIDTSGGDGAPSSGGGREGSVGCEDEDGGEGGEEGGRSASNDR